jgi:hypothetical protein
MALLVVCDSGSMQLKCLNRLVRQRIGIRVQGETTKESVYSTFNQARDKYKKFDQCRARGCEQYYVHDTIWTRNFIQSRRYNIKDNVVFQDNKSAILLEKKGQKSSTKPTWHLDIRCFFITDNIKQGAVRVEYCITENMFADFFTKPLQGSIFRKMAKQILNINKSKLDDSSH